jgi:lipoprotein signal peptidase
MWTLRDPLVRDLTKGSLPRLAAGLGGEGAPGRREPVPERRSMSSVPHQERSSERRSGRAGRWRRNRPYGRRSTDHEPQDGWRPALAILLVVALLDWATKAVVAAAVPLGGFVEVWPGRVALWHVKNPEMVLGLWGNLPLGGRQAIAVMAAVVGLLALYEIIGRGHRLPPHRRRWAWLFVGLAFGGMLGNLGERALHWGVTDYLSFAWGSIWLPPGNVADLALLTSMPLALVVIVFELQARAQRRPAAAVRDPRLSSASSVPR